MKIKNQSYEAARTYGNVFPKQLAWVITLSVWAIILGSVLFSNSEEYKRGAVYSLVVFVVLLFCLLIYIAIIGDLSNETIYKIDVLGWMFHITLISLAIKEFITNDYNVSLLGPIMIMMLFILYKITSGIIKDSWIEEQNERGFLATMLPDAFVDTKLWLTYIFWKRKFGKNQIKYKLNVFDFYKGKDRKINKSRSVNLGRIYEDVLSKLECIKDPLCIYISKNGDLHLIHEFKKPKNWNSSKNMERELEKILFELVKEASINYDVYKSKILQLNRADNLYTMLNNNEIESLSEKRVVRRRAKI